MLNTQIINILYEKDMNSSILYLSIYGPHGTFYVKIEAHMKLIVDDSCIPSFFDLFVLLSPQNAFISAVTLSVYFYPLSE
jgi:hypothetical protein